MKKLKIEKATWGILALLLAIATVVADTIPMSYVGRLVFILIAAWCFHKWNKEEEEIEYHSVRRQDADFDVRPPETRE